MRLAGIIASRPAGAVTFPLDAYTTGLAGAYDTRRLLTSWTGNLIRVRRSSDSAEANIGSDGSGNLDETALTAHVGANHGDIVTYFDQSGLGRDFTCNEGGGGTLLRIVTTGTIERQNGHPVGKHVTGNSEWYRTATFTAYTGTTLAGLAVFKAATNADGDRLFSWIKNSSIDYGGAGQATLLMDNAGAEVYTYRNAAINRHLAITDAGWNAVYSRFDATNNYVVTGSANSSAASTGSFDTNQFNSGPVEAPLTNALNIGSFFATRVWWAADPGATAMNAIRSEAATYWGAT